MQSTAKDLNAYLDEVPLERREALEKLRALCLKHLPGFEEAMTYGMPGYARNGVVEVGFASQKHFIALYILRTDVMKSHRELLQIKGVSLGKGCIRYSSAAKIDFKIVESMLKATRQSTGPVC